MIETYLWTRPKILCRDYVLLRENVEQGRLRFDGPLTSNARVHVNGSEWTVNRTGLLRPVIAIRGREAAIAEGRMRAGGSCDAVVAGRAFRWCQPSLFSSEFRWEDEQGAVVVRYLPALRVTRTVHAESSLPEDLKLVLLFMGGYVLTLHYDDAATMTILIGSTAAS